jgi:uncharacterized membrane protein
VKKETSYKIWRAATTFFVAFGFAFALVQEQIIMALAVLAAGFAILQVLRARYKSIILSDERTKRINEKAAFGTFWVLMVGGAVLIFSQLILNYLGITIEPLASLTEPLSYFILALMLIHSVLTLYYSRKM